MAGFFVDWLNLLLRWGHMTLGIAWIGASFHFVWLDFSLRKRERMNDGVYGTSWMVHGGGFYHVEKYLVAPGTLPGDLHWFQWEAYLTWVSGMFLLAVQYYWNADAYLIDASVMSLSQPAAIAISLVTLAAGWLIYDGLCKSVIGRNPGLLVACVFVLVVGAAYLFTHIFSGRGALIHVGAFMGTNEILTSLMLVYVAERIIDYFVRGPWRDPAGLNFPLTANFDNTLPALFRRSPIHLDSIFALVVVAAAAIMLWRGLKGFEIRVLGQAPRAGLFAGFSPERTTLVVFAVSGALAGLAGISVADGTMGMLQIPFASGYGFTAIIVAFLGRLNPIGVLLAGLLLALSYLGGEQAQIALKVPIGITSVIQGLLLFYVLACDTLILYRLRLRRLEPKVA